MHQMVVFEGAPASFMIFSISWTCAALSTFGSRIASGPAFDAAIMSSLPQGVSRPFTRMMISRLPYSPDAALAQTIPRASTLASGATASSRSRMSASAAKLLAFSCARALEPGIYRTERRGRMFFVMIYPSGVMPFSIVCSELKMLPHHNKFLLRRNEKGHI